ncbi:oxidoreductase-like domain-containing protein [Crenobacter sp. SG2303]|uniref:Oxidoreductase-like domain-containing protein n=1 Tax=Crenobacter oryzisoli TaxID=3056844 RepID=A0ABT7XQN8_9NEIS|nr:MULTISPECIES: oxidoreductase-like domain-containing protein [unclassified Crenobacter]MDN0076060.1 oxidoreductase-like domain-containing protein [Crenobacter sp. SG2303]MDN0081855.1 oxidoreductase-like domain-containing protein [Crenobacter sp. SG2305]
MSDAPLPGDVDLVEPSKPVDDDPFDPEPEAPEPPADGACCDSGCDPCVWDIYREQMDEYRAKLAAWKARNGIQG